MAYDTTALRREPAKLCLHRIEESEDFAVVEPAILEGDSWKRLSF